MIHNRISRDPGATTQAKNLNSNVIVSCRSVLLQFTLYQVTYQVIE